MNAVPEHYAVFEAPDLAPVIVTERTPGGWRGLTGDGEILNVAAHVNGTPVVIPDSLAISRGGEIIGYRTIEQTVSEGVIDRYTHHLDASTALLRSNDAMQALQEIDIALAYAPTMLARFNRALTLLTLGHWSQGFDEFAFCEQNSPLFMRPNYLAAVTAGLAPWQGEDIDGKTLLLIHDHGFGDSIMCLRYVPMLRAMGADVILDVPPELRRLAVQCAPVVTCYPGPPQADYVCSLLLLMQVRKEAPDRVDDAPYLTVDPTLVAKWRARLPATDRRRIGIAWSVGKAVDGDYPRPAPLALFRDYLGRDGELVSVQQQGGEEAQALDIAHFAFDDFADCAALMSLMDEIVTVDTAAAHLAGATGHPRISLLLSHWSSWRWQAPLYRNLRICRQDSAGDWASAFAKL